MHKAIKGILSRYGELLREVDCWFSSCLSLHKDQIACRQGCSACCRGLFDITLLDALYLQSGFKLLPEDLQDILRRRAGARLDILTSLHPSFATPWILNDLPESEWAEMMPEEDKTPCLLLGDDGSCLIYDHRPMNCRLHGIPLFDTSGDDLSDEWCTLNFTRSDPARMQAIRYPFYELFAQELLLFRQMTKLLLGEATNELDTIIPAAVLLDEEMIAVARKKPGW